MTMMGYIVLLGKRDRDGTGRDRRHIGRKEGDVGDGMSNSPAPVGKGPGLPGPEGGPHPPSQGFINGAVARAPSGLETKVDLINGNPARDGATPKGRPRWWGRSARRSRAAHEALIERARQSLPGTSGEDPGDKRD